MHVICYLHLAVYVIKYSLTISPTPAYNAHASARQGGLALFQTTYKRKFFTGQNFCQASFLCYRDIQIVTNVVKVTISSIPSLTQDKKKHVIKNLLMRAGGVIGKRFLLAKISGYMVLLT